MIVSFTGHRPTKIGGYKIPNPSYDKILDLTKQILISCKTKKCITGMALGFDTLGAWACMELNIPYIAAVPFKGQEKLWPEKSQFQYKFLLTRAAETVYTSDPGFSAKKMQIRNEWMVDHAEVVLACWDGSNGGTANCVKYAAKQSKKIIRINPAKEFKVTEIKSI